MKWLVQHEARDLAVVVGLVPSGFNAIGLAYYLRDFSMC